MKRLVLLLAVLFAMPAFAATGSVTLNWVLPTVGCTVGVTPCDNAPLTGANALTGVEVYISTSPIADTSTMAPTATLGPAATTTLQTLTVLNGQTVYARVKARTASGAGPFSNQVSKLIQLPALPGVPTSVTLTLTIN